MPIVLLSLSLEVFVVLFDLLFRSTPLWWSASRLLEHFFGKNVVTQKQDPPVDHPSPPCVVCGMNTSSTWRHQSCVLFLAALREESTLRHSLNHDLDEALYVWFHLSWFHPQQKRPPFLNKDHTVIPVWPISTDIIFSRWQNHLDRESCCEHLHYFLLMDRALQMSVLAYNYQYLSFY